MRSPEDMTTIQIDITNACIHNCSNCTRMCGHHERPFFMDWETFKRAVDSLEGFEGRIGIMGGEPTLHPQFERFVQYVASKYPPKNPEQNYFLRPTKQFMRDRILEERNYNYTYDYKNSDKIGHRSKGPGLWSSLASNYHRYYELIQDTFTYQCLNDHIVGSMHQPVLVSRKDLGIADDKWVKLRDNCWMQNRWSATITPKGCFFCEIAGALDMLFEGPGGWQIEPEWWKRKPEAFTEQLHWCELCGIALETRSRDANEGVDDASETLYKMLERKETPKFKRGQVSIYNGEKESGVRKYAYHNNNIVRLDSKNHSIYPKGFVFALISSKTDAKEDVLSFIENNHDQAMEMYCFVNEGLLDELTRIIEGRGLTNVYLKRRSDKTGDDINTLNRCCGDDANIILASSDMIACKRFADVMKMYAFNPGVFYYLRGTSVEKSRFFHFSDREDAKGYFILYSPLAYAIREAGFDGIAACKDIDDFEEIWKDESKKVEITDELFEDRNPLNQLEYEMGLRYAVYGTGLYGDRAFIQIEEAGSQVVFYCDSAGEKVGTDLHNIKIHRPEDLVKNRGDFDKIVIASVAYKDIRKTILELGFTDEQIVAPIF